MHWKYSVYRRLCVESKLTSFCCDRRAIRLITYVRRICLRPPPFPTHDAQWRRLCHIADGGLQEVSVEDIYMSEPGVVILWIASSRAKAPTEAGHLVRTAAGKSGSISNGPGLSTEEPSRPRSRAICDIAATCMRLRVRQQAHLFVTHVTRLGRVRNDYEAESDER